jgi:acyl-CoA thioesterase
VTGATPERREYLNETTKNSTKEIIERTKENRSVDIRKMSTPQEKSEYHRVWLKSRISMPKEECHITHNTRTIPV